MWQTGELNAVKLPSGTIIKVKLAAVKRALINCLEEKTNETCTETLN